LNHRRVYAIALGGVLTALSCALMMFGSVIPFATFVVPCLAALSVAYFCVEYNLRTAMMVYASISLLSLLLSADRELSLVFVFVTGCYPVIKVVLERTRRRILSWTLKLLWFNAAIVSMYALITRIFVVAQVRSEFEEFTSGFTLLLLALANLTFFLYDLNLTRLTRIYLRRRHP